MDGRHRQMQRRSPCDGRPTRCKRRVESGRAVATSGGFG